MFIFILPMYLRNLCKKILVEHNALELHLYFIIVTFSISLFVTVSALSNFLLKAWYICGKATQIVFIYLTLLKTTMVNHGNLVSWIQSLAKFKSYIVGDCIYLKISPKKDSLNYWTDSASSVSRTNRKWHYRRVYHYRFFLNSLFFV